MSHNYKKQDIIIFLILSVILHSPRSIELCFYKKYEDKNESVYLDAIDKKIEHFFHSNQFGKYIKK
jgi:hypothetical protein